MAKYLETIAKLIARTGIISFGHYILSNGLHSPYYIDFTLLANKPDYLDTLIDITVDYLEKERAINNIDKIVGILDKGVIVAVPLAIRKKIPFALFSMKTRDISIGSIDVNEKILLVDDMLSTGNTISRVINIIKRKYKNQIKKVFVLFDREEGGWEKLRKRKIAIYRLVKVKKLSETLLSYGIISEEEYEIIMNHLKEIRERE